jgi:hypothetical protein
MAGSRISVALTLAPPALAELVGVHVDVPGPDVDIQSVVLDVPGQGLGGVIRVSRAACFFVHHVVGSGRLLLACRLAVMARDVVSLDGR